MPWCRRQRSAGRARLGERPRRRTARDSSLSFSQRNDGPTARCLGRQSPDALVLGAGELLDTIVSVVHDLDVSARIGRHTNGFEIEPPTPRCQERAAPVELLDAGVEFRYVHVPGRIGRHALRLRLEVPPHGEERAHRVEFLDAEVASIRHVYVPARIGSHRDGRIELPTTPPSEKEVAARVEFLDAVMQMVVIVNVRHVDTFAPIRRHAGGQTELSGARACTPPRREECPAGVELLDTAIAAVRHIDVPPTVGRHAKGVTELPVTRAAAPPRREESAAGVELLNAVVAGVRDVDVSTPVNRDTRGVDEFAVATARRTPLQHERAWWLRCGGRYGRGRARCGGGCARYGGARGGCRGGRGDRGSGGRGRRGRFSAVGRRWVRGGLARRHVGPLLVPACLFADLVLAAARLARLGLSHDLLLAVAPALGEGG